MNAPLVHKVKELEFYLQSNCHEALYGKKLEIYHAGTVSITHHLMLNAYFMHNIGLAHGKMGIVLAMSEYSKFTGNKIYFDVASYLLDDVIEKLHNAIDYSFSTGLSGIGWGIEYLLQHGFVEGASVVICEEIDRKIMETDPNRISDFSLDTGFEGLLHYIIYHLQGAIKQKTELPFDKKYLSDVHTVCLQLKEQEKTGKTNLLPDMYIDFYNTGILKEYNVPIVDFVTVESTSITEKIYSYPLGLKDGLAGKLLKSINAR